MGQAQNPSATSTGGHCPPGPAACGMAMPSGVCAAAIKLATSLTGAATEVLALALGTGVVLALAFVAEAEEWW